MVPLKHHQIAALRFLAEHPENPYGDGHVEPATLSLLRKRGLVGKVVERRNGRRETRSPVTDAGRALLAAQQPLPSEYAPEPVALGYMQGRGAA
jgi:hypothetical protein